MLKRIFIEHQNKTNNVATHKIANKHSQQTTTRQKSNEHQEEIIPIANRV